MARSYPADTKLQHFYTQQFEKESASQLDFYFKTKDGNNKRPAGNSAKMYHGQRGLPDIIPMEFALKKKREEDELMRQIIEQARSRQVKEEMLQPDLTTKAALYEGFTKEGRGRYRYLSERHQITPEQKFTFPMISSWEYGWKIGEEVGEYKRPKHARTSTIKDSFYTRNGIMSPTGGNVLERSTTYA